LTNVFDRLDPWLSNTHPFHDTRLWREPQWMQLFTTQ
jgi:hypothetical protein